VVLARKGPAGVRELDLLFHGAGVEIVPFSEAHLRLAREAYERYGKGRNPARLNLGDCCAYALSRHSGEPLLFKGNDFARTDVQTAMRP
jgi:ribonuclease VapC